MKLPKTLIQTLTTPVQFGIYRSSLGVENQVGFIFLARKASLENRALRSQLGTLLVENAILQKKLKETEGMINSYNKLNPQTYDLLPARPIGLGRNLLIDKGESDGVKLGQTVVFKDFYLGRVKSVDSKTATILLSTDPDSKITVFSQNADGKAKGILEGKFGSETLMDKILHQEKINVGDLVYSDGTDGHLPRGLLMGKVAEVLERQNEVFKQAKVEPIFNISDLEVVFVIRSS